MRKQKRTEARWSSSRLPQFSVAVLVASLAATAFAASNAARDALDSRISVTNVAGDVAVTMAGNAIDVAPEATVLLPAHIVTGHDGSLGLSQAGTNISVSSDTEVEIPAEAVDGNLVARLVQYRGNVFYDVAPREAGKLRVETPLLVAVIKGTQFNVAVQPDSTTISLFEGRLEIRTPDGSDVVQLTAGEIAIRSRLDAEIRVVGMNDERVDLPRTAQPAADEGAAQRLLDLTGTAALLNDGDLVSPAAIAGVTSTPDLGAGAKPIVDAGLDTVSVATGSGLGVDVSLDSASVALDTGLDLGGNDIGASLDAGVDVGAATVDVGLDAGLDLGNGSLDVGLTTGVDVAGAGVDVGVDAGLDLGGGAVDLGLDAGVDVGGAATLDLGVDAGVDLGALDATVDAGVDLGVVDATVDAGVDLGSGTIDLSVDLGGALDAGLTLVLGAGTLDLGLGEDSTEPEQAPTSPPPRGGLGGLLGGLL